MPDFVEKLHFVIYANSIMMTDSMAGGYRIFIECLRYWLDQGHTAELLTSPQGDLLVQRYIQSTRLTTHVVGPKGPRDDLIIQSLWFSGPTYALRALKGIFQAFKAPRCNPRTVLYSTTPFWPDIYPALIQHFRSPDTVWLAAFSMFAPRVFGGWSSGMHSESKLIEPRALALKLNELPVYPSVKKWADIIYVNNDLDLERIRSDGISEERSLVIGGGVDVAYSNSIFSEEAIEFENEAVFVGRFHPQKGVLELVDIWQEVCQTLPSAKLVMIGNGPLEKAVAQKIDKMRLEKNIVLVGFKDGVEKLRIFHRSRVVLHPSIYDSGGMAAAEAMICGLPGVSYDLPALRTYYPKGMLKARDSQEFATHIIHLLTDSSYYNKMSSEARGWALKWDWRIVSQQLLDRCQSHCQKRTPISDF